MDKTEWIELDCSSASKKLVSFAGRILKLLQSKPVQSNQYALAVLDDLLGGLHALIMSLHHNPPFKDRTDQAIEIKPLVERASGIAQDHRIRLTGAWMAGYHFNSALFRLAAVYNRSLKVITNQPDKEGGIGQRGNQKSLISEAKQIFRKWTGDDWKDENSGKVYDEINALKHDAQGIFPGRTVAISQGADALDELLVLLETWNSHSG